LKKHLRSLVTVWTSGLISVVVCSAGTVETAQQQATSPAGAAPQQTAPPEGGRGRGRGPAPVDTLGAGPWDLGAGRGVRIHVTAVKGLDHPWGIAFVPGGDQLVTERPGRLRIIRNGVLDPTPVGPLPSMVAAGLGGLLDVSLHPQFATNHLIYLAYSKPAEGVGDATTAVYRARWDGGATLADGKDIFVARSVKATTDQSIGPASGSFDLPEIYTLGHRNPLGLYVNPITSDLWSTEEGPQGGDELNLIKAGKNYGWPRVSLGRNYDGTIVGEGFTAPGLEEPVAFWVPAIAISGLSIYNGDAFPAWKGHVFVGAMRANTGQHIQRVWFNPKGEPIGREIFLAELKQRIREVKPGPDGFLYALTDETFGAVLKIEPGR
jgi:glucose/arabinose dehydrogenase